MTIIVRQMVESDCEILANGFKEQGWNKPLSQYENYYHQQSLGNHLVFIGVLDGHVAGYALLLPFDCSGPFKESKIPCIYDFNVLMKYQRQGVGTAILDGIEQNVSSYSNQICLGVGLHSGYGAAQRLYIKRGYIPDGSGVWYQNEPLGQYMPCVNDDDLVLYLYKTFKKDA